MDLPELDRAVEAERAAYDDNRHPHYDSGPKGGQFAPANTSGSSGYSSVSGPDPANRKSGGKPRHNNSKPITAVKSTHRGPMKRGGDNDPEQVKQLQALLGVLGLGKPPTNGQFDDATEQAVMEAQRRLGLKPNGHASTALLNKLITAHALSPCVQRSEGFDEFDLLRAALGRGDFDENHVLDNGICRTCKGAQRSAPHPGQRYRHGWIPIGGTLGDVAGAREVLSTDKRAGDAKTAARLADALADPDTDPDEVGFTHIGTGSQREVWLDPSTETVYKTGDDSANRHEVHALIGAQAKGRDYAPDATLYEVDVTSPDPYGFDDDRKQTVTVVAMPYLPEDGSVPHEGVVFPEAADFNMDNVVAHGGKLWLIDAGGM